MTSLRKRVRKTAYAICTTVLSVAILLAILEAAYRYQIVDTYRPELIQLNDREDLGEGGEKKTVLLLGDSFTATSWGYPAVLRRNQDRYRIINGGISGTGIIQTNIVAPGRFEKFGPDIVVYQVYVGNDLINVRYPVNWNTLPVLRNAYYVAVSYFRSLEFLNYRLGQLYYQLQKKKAILRNVDIFQQVRARQNLDSRDVFSAETYPVYDVLYLRADPLVLEKQVMVQGDRREDFGDFLEGLAELLGRSNDQQFEAYLLIIPHSCQVNRVYLENMRKLGAQFSDPEEMLTGTYPFAEETKAFIRRQGLNHVTVLDPIELIRAEEEKGNHMYYLNDPHMNSAGQELIARYLIDHIVNPSGQPSPEGN